ncbi:MAG: LamG-like jellyroll fold domain-containing protein, partial [Candidatus Thorarchaeota archaeon]
TVTNDNFAYINVTTSDTNDRTSFIDWNRSLVGYWGFEQVNSSNYTWDNSTWGNDGKLVNFNEESPSTVYGKYGRALEFDGVNDYVYVGNDTNPLNGITVEAWIKPNVVNSWQQASVVSKFETNAYQWKIGLTNVGKLRADIYTNQTNVVSPISTGAMSVDEWYHIATTYNGTHAYVYLNGAQSVAFSGINGPIQNNNSNIRIGHEPVNNRYFNGTIDEVRIWNRALSPEEINASYNTGSYRLYRNFTGLTDGSYDYYAFTKDAAGNTNTTETRTFTVETVAPTWSQLSSNVTNNTVIQSGTLIEVRANWSNTELDYSWVETNGSGSWSNSSYTSLSGVWNWSNLTIDTTGFNEGYFFIRQYANDTAGNDNVTGNWIFTIDDTNPVINFTTPTPFNNTASNINQTYINFSVTESHPDIMTLEWNGTNVTLDSPDLVLNLHFDNSSDIGENNTHIIDLSRYGNNGTTQGDAITNATGKFGGALWLDGSGDYVDVGTDTSLNITYPITLCAWVKPAGTATYQDVISKRNVTVEQNNYALRVKEGTYFGYYFRGTDGNWHEYYTPVGTLTLGEWAHICAVRYGDNTIKLFKNGNVNTTTSTTFDVLTSSAPVQISGWDGANEVFNGTIDEVRIWNRALSPEEINASYRMSIGKYYANITDLSEGQYYYKGFINDTSGNENVTEKRLFTTDYTNPTINFTAPTPSNNTVTNDNFAYINVTTGDTNDRTSFIDWNYSLVGYWGFERVNASNYTFDNSTYGNDGLLKNFDEENPATTYGKYGRALEFDGSTSRQGIEVANHDSLKFGSGDFTLSAWIKTTQTGVWKRIITKRGSASYWYSMAMRNGNLTAEIYGTTAARTYEGDAIINDGVWHNVVVLKDTTNNKIRLYVDGMLD